MKMDVGRHIKLLLLFFMGTYWISKGNSLADTSGKWKYGVNISYITPIETGLFFDDGLVIIPSVQVKKDRHNIFLGPITYPEVYPNSVSQSNRFIEGISLSYWYFPLLSSIKFNPYFLFNLRFFIYPVINEIGYGWNFFITNNFYLNQSMAIGTETYNLKSIYGSDFSATFKVGCGYIFQRKTNIK